MIVDAVRSQRQLPRRRRRLGVRYPTAAAIHYKRDIAAYVEKMRSIVDEWAKDRLQFELERLAAERGDEQSRVDSMNTLEDALDRLEMALIYALLPTSIRNMVRRRAEEALATARRQWTRSLELARGETPHFNEESLGAIVDAFIAENAALIEDVPRKYMANIRRIVFSGFLTGASYATIKREIEEAVPQSSAGAISVDQMGLLVAATSASLHSSAGLATYVWCDNRDERVRGNPSGLYPKARYSHWVRNGKVFKWGSPPPDGHPGVAPNCRCWAAVNEEEARGQQAKMAREGEMYDEVQV